MVHSGCGADVTSSAAVLTVNPSTSITTQPTNQIACAGSNATFTVVAAGTAPITYQWKKGASNIVGATSASLTLNNVTAADAASYTVVVHSGCGADVTSAAATLTVNAATSITTQPTSQTLCAGSNATFTVVASGTGTITYQWKKGASNIVGATSASLTINNISAADAASYTVVVHSDCGADVNQFSGSINGQSINLYNDTANKSDGMCGEQCNVYSSSSRHSTDYISVEKGRNQYSRRNECQPNLK